MSKELLRTTPAETDGHYHIVYVNEEAQQASSSHADDGHTHEVGWGPDGALSVYPAEDHLHELEEYAIKEKKSKEKKEDIVREVLNLYLPAREAEAEARDAADESEKFYCGEQWEEEVKDKLSKEARAALTINHIERYMDLLFGYQREQKTTLHYLAVEGGDQAVADLLNLVAGHILEKCGYQREKCRVFEDQSIVGRANWNVYVSFDKDLRGDIAIECFPWNRTTYGPHEKLDASDCEYRFKEQKVSLANLKRKWPKKVKELEQDYLAYTSDDRAIVREDTTKDPYEQGTFIDRMPMVHLGDEMIDIANKEYRELECWRIVYLKTPIAIRVEDDFYFNAFWWDAKDVNKIKTIPGFRVVERQLPKIRITTIAGNVLLRDENPARLPVDDFFFFPVYAKKRRGKWWGKVESGKDAQKECNKRHSQAVDIANKVASYVWIYDDSTFANRAEEKKFIRYANSPGARIKVQDASRPPGKLEGVKFPDEIIGLLNLSQEELSSLLNVEAQPNGANESGAHLLQRQKTKLLGNEYLFDELAWSEKRIGKLLVPLIKKYYSPERILRIVANQNTKQPVEIGGQPFEQWEEQAILELFQNDDLENYDVEVAQVDYSPTARMGVFMLLQDLAKSGYQIPPDILLELSEVPHEMKQKILQGMQAESQAAAMEQEASKLMEENKTLIAKDIIPPAVQHRLEQEAMEVAQGQDDFTSSGEAPM